jgi:hypothetical protein
VAAIVLEVAHLAGHGPSHPVVGSTCACGATGITDWPAHIAEAATREDRA